MSSMLRQELHRLIDALPDTLLAEIANWLRSARLLLPLSVKEPSAPLTTPYTPVKLGGLWQTVSISDQDLTEARQTIWKGFGEQIE